MILTNFETMINYRLYLEGTSSILALLPERYPIFQVTQDPNALFEFSIEISLAEWH